VNWAARWGGLGMALVAAAALLFSIWWELRTQRAAGSTHLTAELSAGCVAVFAFVPPSESGFIFADYVAVQGVELSQRWEPFRWLPHVWWNQEASKRTGLRIPLWMFLPLSLSISVAGWKMRPNRGGRPRCPSCTYDLSGLPTGSPCPECAAVPRS
jgi:hypothetical protein